MLLQSLKCCSSHLQLLAPQQQTMRRQTWQTLLQAVLTTAFLHTLLPSLISLPHLSRYLHCCCPAAGRSSRASSADRTASLHALLRNPDGLSAQHSRGRLLPVVDYLVRHGADVNARDEDGRSALHLAAGAGDVAMVAKLAELGIDVNGKDNVGGRRELLSVQTRLGCADMALNHIVLWGPRCICHTSEGFSDRFPPCSRDMSGAPVGAPQVFKLVRSS